MDNGLTTLNIVIVIDKKIILSKNIHKLNNNIDDIKNLFSNSANITCGFITYIINSTRNLFIFCNDKSNTIYTSLKNDDFKFKDSGIEQTWNFAHPNNKKVTGPLGNFKRMLKGDSYQMMIDHLSHTITQLGSTDKWAQFEVISAIYSKLRRFYWA